MELEKTQKVTEFLISKRIAKSWEEASRIMESKFPYSYYEAYSYGKSPFGIRPGMYVYLIFNIFPVREIGGNKEVK